jgi:hypothetical protein
MKNRNLIRMKFHRGSLLMLIFISMFISGCKSSNLDLISDETTGIYIQEVYGKYATFEVQELSKYYLQTIKLRFVTYLEIMDNDHNNEEKYKTMVDNEMPFSERQYYALIIISNMFYAFKNLDIKIELLDEENNAIPGKFYYTEDFTTSSRGIAKYYFVYKTEKPIDQNVSAKLAIQFPNGKKRTYKIDVAH